MARLKKEAAARHAEWTRPDYLSGRGDFAALASPLFADLVGVETEVDRVVVEESLCIDVTRKLYVVASFQGGQELGPDLDVPLHAVQVYPLSLPGAAQPLAQ
jgi:hypothetical protein